MTLGAAMFYRPTPEALRVEIARHLLSKTELARHIGMVRPQLSAYLTGRAYLHDWAAHNIGLGINQLTGLYIFEVDMNLPFQTGPKGRPISGTRFSLDTGPRSQRRR